jgi:hypothetical protein
MLGIVVGCGCGGSERCWSSWAGAGRAALIASRGRAGRGLVVSASSSLHIFFFCSPGSRVLRFPASSGPIRVLSSSKAGAHQGSPPASSISSCFLRFRPLLKSGASEARAEHSAGGRVTKPIPSLPCRTRHAPDLPAPGLNRQHDPDSFTDWETSRNIGP